MNKFRLYLVEYPVAYFKDICHKTREYILNKFREWIYRYEFNKVLSPKVKDIYDCCYDVSSADLRIGVFCPALVVSKILEKHFGFYGYYLLNIHGIDVDTQQNEIVVTIKLYRPGLLIGKAGKDIDTIKQMLWNYFNKKVRIDIVEVKTDVNKVETFYW